MVHAPNTLSLVADVGGTNTRVALAKGSTLLKDTVAKYRNSDFNELEHVLTGYVQDQNVDCIGAAAAVAGPVRNGRGSLTNLDWSIDNDMLGRVTRAEHLAVLNDLQAQAHALGHIQPGNLRRVIEGTKAPAGATQLVIGIGTGFNAAVALETECGRIVPPSECGHMGMPIKTKEGLSLGEFVKAKHGFSSIEDVLSGRGLEHIYAWRAGQTRPAREIMAACANGVDPHATETVASFVRLMGAVAGDLALTHLPFGGLYLIGGVARATCKYFKRFGFSENFRDKGRFTDFMNQFQVSVVEDDFAALEGLAAHLNSRF